MSNLKRNFIYNTFYQVINIIAPLITAPYISRVLGANGIGIHSYTCSIQGYFSLFAALGTTYYGAREISRNRDDIYMRSKLFWEIELMTIISSLACLVIWFAFIFNTDTYRIYYVVLTLNILATMFDISWFFTGLEQLQIIVFRNTIIKIFSIVLTLTVVNSSEDLIKYIIIYAGTTFASSLSIWFYLHKYIQKVHFEDLNILRHFRETFIYFIPTVSTSVYTLLDKTLIGVITGNETENGYYAQAEKIINLAKTLVFSSISLVVGTRISYLFTENKIEEIHRRIENSINFIWFMGIGCSCGIAGVAANFVPLFYGEGYDSVIRLLYIFSPIILIIGISNCVETHYYIPSGNRAKSTRYIILGAIINFVLNVILIPPLKAAGAAIASVVAETVITSLYIKGCDGYITANLLLRTGWTKAIAGGIIFFVVRTMGMLKMNALLVICLQVSVGTLTYIIALIILKDKWIKSFFELLNRRLIKKSV